MNAVFFDGHAESLQDLDSADPKFWLPKGARIADVSKIWPDVITRYGVGVGYTVP